MAIVLKPLLTDVFFATFLVAVFGLVVAIVVRGFTGGLAGFVLIAALAVFALVELDVFVVLIGLSTPLVPTGALLLTSLGLTEDATPPGRRGERPSIDLFLSIVYNYTIMVIKLTKKQLAVLDFLRDFTDEKGYSPSYREIMSGLGLSSVSAVAEHVDNLVKKGVLKKVPGAARSLEILDYKHEETVNLFQEKLITCTESEQAILRQAADILGLDLSESPSSSEFSVETK